MSQKPITMTVGGIAVPAMGPGRVVQEATIGCLTGIGGHPGAREDGEIASPDGGQEGRSRPSRRPRPGIRTLQRPLRGPKMARSPLPMGSNTLDPGHSMTRHRAPTNHRRISRCPPGSQPNGLSGLRRTVTFPPLTLNRPPIRSTPTQHRYLSPHPNPGVRHGSESPVGIGRNHCSASAGISVRLRRNTDGRAGLRLVTVG